MKKIIIFLMLYIPFIASSNQGDGGVIKATLDGIENIETFTKTCKYWVLHKEYVIETVPFDGLTDKYAVLRDSKGNEVERNEVYSSGKFMASITLESKIAKWKDCPNEMLYVWNVLERNLREKN